METKGVPPQRLEGEPGQVPTEPGNAQRILAVALELTKRAAELISVDDLYFFLVNDLRGLIEFDRCFLITHMQNNSHTVAAANQPVVDGKSKLYNELNRLAPELKNLRKGLLLSGTLDAHDERFKDLDEALKEALREYLGVSECAFLLAIPLIHQNVVLAHLLLEFMGSPPPNQANVMALVHIAPVVAAVMVEKWLIQKNPGIMSTIAPELSGRSRSARIFFAYWQWILGTCLVIGLLLFVLPVNYTVGGESEIGSWDKTVAFCQMDGLIEKVLTSEGSQVKRDQKLAVLDPKELNYKIESSRREYELLSKQAAVLVREADKEPPKLAEAQIVELKRRKVHNDLEYYLWQRRFLEIKAPADGIVITKEVQSLAGKKFKAGESFCEIGVPTDVCVDVFVPEDKIGLVKTGQHMFVYLNSDPLKGYKLQVDKISPAAEVAQRLGNVVRVSARFPYAPETVRFGLKGVGKIQVAKTNIWFIIKQHIAPLWNRLSLHF